MIEEEESAAAEAKPLAEANLVTEGQSNPFDIQVNKNSILTIVICSIISVVFLRAGFLSFFFLAPLGLAVLLTGSFVLTFITAAAANFALTFFMYSGDMEARDSLWMTLLFYSVIFFGFSWIMGGKNIRTIYRFVISSIAGAIFFMILINRSDSVFFDVFEKISAQMFEETVNAQELIQTSKNILLRGGAVVSMLFLFFINRHVALSVFGMIKRQRKSGGLISFFAPPNTIWIFLGALSTIVAASSFKAEILEIMAWNVFVIFGIIFMVQGFGILMYLVSRKSTGFRAALYILFTVTMISPAGTIAAAAVLILGVVENWVPIRIRMSARFK